MASSLATAVYAAIAVWILLNSVLESDDRDIGAIGYAAMLVVAAAWPIVFLAWPLLAGPISTKADLATPD